MTGTTTVSGVISAKGGRRDAYPYGVGAGGSVFLTTAALAGNGTIAANGADANENTTGGGGRVAVILTNSADFGSIAVQAYPGLPSGAAGTVYLQTPAQGAGRGTLLIDAANRVPKFGSARTLVCSNVTDAVVGTVILTNKAILAIDTNQSLRVNGSWTNAATFVAAVGAAVEFAGADLATVAGSNSFQNLIITNAGKVVSFQAGRTNLVAGLLKLGSPGQGTTVTLQSTADGGWWYLSLTTNAGGTQQIARVAVRDSHAGGGQPLLAGKGSVDGGHNVNWLFPRIAGTVIWVR